MGFLPFDHSIEYWFRCLDLDGDGALSLYEMDYFYQEVQQRLRELNIDCLSVENTMCQILDMINPKEKGTPYYGHLASVAHVDRRIEE